MRFPQTSTLLFSIRNHFLRTLSAYYWAAYSLHHALFLRPGKKLVNSRLIVVGSFRAGGAGKTPFCLWLAKEFLRQEKTVAILCHKKAFDEVRMYKHALSDFVKQGFAEIIATENRYQSAHLLDQRSPRPATSQTNSSGIRGAPDVILCDDGFEDSRLVPDRIFRLDWEAPPTDIGQLLPAGIFRSLLQDHRKDESRTTVLRCYGTKPDVIFNIESITNAAGEFPKNGKTIAICGIGDPNRFVNDLRKAEYAPAKVILCPDHDAGFEKKVETALQKYPAASLILTEKDSCRLDNDILQNPRIFVARQSIKTFSCCYIFLTKEDLGK